MSPSSLFDTPDPSLRATPTLELRVGGPRGEDGFLLRAPHDEALLWDLENEVVTSRRHWVAEREAWWVATSYLNTVVDIVLRAFPSVLVLDAAGGDRLLSRDGVTMRQERLL